MTTGGGGGGGDVSRAQQPAGRGERRGHRQKAAGLPLDVVAEIAARSDPATLVRCAATCRDARRRIAGDPRFLDRLRLRDTDRFVLPLLRGHVTRTMTFSGPGGWLMEIHVYMVDTTGAADATRLVEADETLRNVWPLDSRGDLVLVRSHHQGPLLVCNMATRRCQALPPEPAFPAPGVSERSVMKPVLLVGNKGGDGVAAVGRPFQVLKTRIVQSESSSVSLLLVHTFSSEHGAWSPITEIEIANQLGSGRWLSQPLVVGDVVHWLCLTNSESYMVMLRVGAARVDVTTLPTSFQRNVKHLYDEGRQYLLATATAGGNPIVLVADTDRISAWEQSKHNKTWKPQSQVVIENETVLGFNDDGLAELVEQERRLGKKRGKHVPELLSEERHCAPSDLWLLFALAGSPLQEDRQVLHGFSVVIPIRTSVLSLRDGRFVLGANL